MEAIGFTLLCSVLAAFYFMTNDVFKIRGDVLIFSRSVAMVIVLLPVLPFLEWDKPLSFYVLIVIAGAAAGLGDIYYFSATRVYSASALSRITSSRHIVLFCLWPFLLAGYWERLSANMLVFGGSIALVSLSCWVVYKMRKSPVNIEIIAAALPGMAFLIVSDLTLALGVLTDTSLLNALSVGLVMGCSMAVVSGALLLIKGVHTEPQVWGEGAWIKAGLANGTLLVGVVVTKTIAIGGLENPGYFGAMVAVYTVWIYLLHKYGLKRAEPTNPKLGFLLVACSIGLGLLAIQIPK
jgi:hypothetical protein